MIPCFNSGPWLLEAVRSVMQTNPGTEIVIVDDGSTKRSTARALAGAERLGANVLTSSNHAVAHARSLAIEHASAPFVVPLDADDRLAAGAVSRAVDLLTTGSRRSES